MIGMRARERTSGQNQQPLPAHPHLSVGNEAGPLEKHTHCIPGEARFLVSCTQSRPALDSSDSGALPTLPLRPKSCDRKQPVSNSLQASPFEINACSGSKTSATDPLHPNFFEIKGCSVVAAGTPFFVKKSKAATSRALFFHTFQAFCDRFQGLLGGAIFPATTKPIANVLQTFCKRIDFAPNPNAINASSGRTERTRFFVKVEAPEKRRVCARSRLDV
jgi:hypothetical protein